MIFPAAIRQALETFLSKRERPPAEYAGGQIEFVTDLIAVSIGPEGITCPGSTQTSTS